MPQLASLNWIFLVILFWLVVFILSMCIWWFKSSYFMIKEIEIKNTEFIGKKWNW